MKDQQPIDMRSLSIFLATAEAGNMTGAATQLGISQSGVSQAIRSLEEDLGTVLFNRDQRPLTLTTAGLALRNRGSVLLEQARTLKGAVLDASRGLRPDLRLGLVDSFAATFGTHLIRLLLEKVTQLSVRTGLTPHLTEGLVRREFDLVVTTDPLDDMGGIVRHHLIAEHFLAIVPKNTKVTLSTIADVRLLAERMPIIRFNSLSHLGMQVERFLRRCGIRASRRLEVDTADTLASMVAGGLGWAVTTPLCVLQAGLYARSVRPLTLPAPSVTRDIYLLTREGEAPNAARHVIDLVQSIFRSDIAPDLRSIDEKMSKLIRMMEAHHND